MVVTENALYLHFPKAGGNWIKQVLKPVTLENFGHAVPGREQLEKYDRIFCAVRNPWSWYVSLYNFLVHGSTHPELVIHTEPLFIAFKKTPSFDEFIEILVHAPRVYKLQISVLTKISCEKDGRPMESPVPQGWLNSDRSFYQTLCDVFLENVTHAGRVESLKDDLENMIKLAGDDTEEVRKLLVSAPPINVGLKQVDYRSMYNSKTRNLVGDSSKKLIDRFGYEF